MPKSLTLGIRLPGWGEGAVSRSSCETVYGHDITGGRGAADTVPSGVSGSRAGRPVQVQCRLMTSPSGSHRKVMCPTPPPRPAPVRTGDGLLRCGVLHELHCRPSVPSPNEHRVDTLLSKHQGAITIRLAWKKRRVK